VQLAVYLFTKLHLDAHRCQESFLARRKEGKNPEELNFKYWQTSAASFLWCVQLLLQASSTLWSEEEEERNPRLHSLSRIQNSVSMPLRFCKFPSSKWVPEL